SLLLSPLSSSSFSSTSTSTTLLWLLPLLHLCLPFLLHFFVFCQSLLQLAQLLVSGCLKSSISTIERRYGFSSQKSGLLASFNEVGNVGLIVFVSFLGSRVHRPRFIGGGALLASLGRTGTLHVFLSAGILLAVTTIGPAFGFIMGFVTLRFFVDIDKVSKDQIDLRQDDLRWVGAWWLGFLVASCFLFLTALPYLFFPKNMPKEVMSRTRTRFPRIALRTLRSSVFLLVVLAQVCLAALVAGLATFMAKFIERQFDRTVSFANMMIGGVDIPLAVVGIVLGGALMRRLSLSVGGAGRLCCAAILLCMFSALPLLLLGCPTQAVAGVFPHSAACHCPAKDFNPVCGSDGVEFQSPCHAGCVTMETDNVTRKVLNYTDCRCVWGGGGGFATPGTCGGGCSHLLLPFMVLSALTCLIASVSQTPSYMMILRTVPPEDKSFAVGVQYMLFRVLAFMPCPVLYGSAIDSSCILWGSKCGKKTSCLYYNMDQFRQRFLGLQAIFICGALLCFVLAVVVLRRHPPARDAAAGRGAGYELVNGQKSPDCSPSKEPRRITT
uniref:Solute carrier organic anion transporter family, member 2B1 n=1 Tax=Myripristis murdjan TaxID=586833 RepID=A0A667Z345_9TELE